MTILDAQNAIVDRLRSIGLFVGGDEKRQIAQKLTSFGVSVDDIDVLQAWVQSEGGLNDWRQFLARRLRESETRDAIHGLVADAKSAASSRMLEMRQRKEIHAQRSKPGPSEQRNPSGSVLKNCDAENPYGWHERSMDAMLKQSPGTEPDDGRCNDHNRPGEWNAFRQCFNLTTDEARAANTNDYRVRGCSRWGAIGCSARSDQIEIARHHAGKGQPPFIVTALRENSIRPFPRWIEMQKRWGDDDLGPRLPSRPVEQPTAESIGRVFGE